MCFACSNVKNIFNFSFFHSWHSSLVFILYIRTVSSQFVHKQSLSVSNKQYLSSWFRTRIPMGLSTMGVKALALLIWLSKEERLLNPRALRSGLLRSWQGCLHATFLPAFTWNFAAPLHICLCLSLTTLYLHLLKSPVKFVLMCWIVNRQRWDAGTHFLQYPSYMCSNLQHKGWTDGQEQYCLQPPEILVTSFTYIPFSNFLYYFMGKSYSAYCILSDWILLLTPFW